MKSIDVCKNKVDLFNIDNEFITNKHEEFYFKTDNKKIFDALKMVIVWCIRTPHVYPFNRKVSKNKYAYKDGLLKYKKALFECVSEYFFHYTNEVDVEYEIFLNINPDARVIFDSIEMWVAKTKLKNEDAFDLMLLMDFNTYLTSSKEIKRIVECSLNALSALIRKRLLDNGHRSKVYDFKKNSTKCYKHFMKVCEQKWNRHRAILLLRLDWGYHARVPDMRAVFTSEEDFENRFKIVSRYRALMLKYLKARFKKDLVLFAWKIECAPIKGLHIHWLIGLNGSKHQDEINVPRSIAEDWTELLGEKDAYVWNLSSKTKDEKSTLRVIKYDDPDLWRIVGGYVDYLTKVDYMVRLKTPKKMHSFGSTKLAEESKRKTGPKRLKETQGLDLMSVRRPLSEMKR